MKNSELFVDYCDTARAARFMQQCNEKGFTPSETACLATLNAWASRSTASNPLATNRTSKLANYVSSAMSAAVKNITTPEDLHEFIISPLRRAIHKWSSGEHLSDKYLKDIFSVLGEGWIGELEQIHIQQPQSWEWALEQVHLSLTHKRMAPEVLKDIPAHTLSQAIRATALNSLSWNSWFYTAEDEGVLAQQLLHADAQLSVLSGLPAGCLGLFGKVNLELDFYGKHVHSGQFYIFTLNGGSMGSVSTGLRVNHDSGWEALPHEWMHAVDFMVARHHNTTANFFSNNDVVLQKMLLEVASRPDSTATQWLEHLKSLQYPNEHKYVQQFQRMTEPLNNFWGDFIALENDPYFTTFPERLAYTMSQASHCMGWDENPIVLGSEQNRKDAQELLPKIFALPQMQSALTCMHKAYTKNKITKNISLRRQKRNSKKANVGVSPQ